MYGNEVIGAYYVGQAIAHTRAGRQDDLKQAARAVGQAYQLFVRSGLQPDQAVQRITSLAETFGSLE